MPNDIDTLMSYVHTINAKDAHEVTDADITVLIAYHRHNRARRAAGEKSLSNKPVKPSIDVLKMLSLDQKPKVAIAGVRRL